MIIDFDNINSELQDKIDWETFVSYMHEFVEISKRPLRVKNFVKGTTKLNYESDIFKLWLTGGDNKYITCYNIKKASNNISIYEILQINLRNKSELIKAIKTMQLRAFI